MSYKSVHNDVKYWKPFLMFVVCYTHVLGKEIDPIKLDICNVMNKGKKEISIKLLKS